MKKIIIQFSVISSFAFICFGVLEKNSLTVYDYVPQDALNLFFTAITVLFPIGMSIAIAIDLSKVVNKKRKPSFVSGLRQTMNSFCFYFIIDCVAMLAVIVLKQIKQEIWIAHLIYVYSAIIILFSVFYFSYNFVRLFNFKRELEDRIAEELQVF